MYVISTTLEVSKFDKSTVFKEIQSKNKLSIVVNAGVLKLDKLADSNE